MYRLESDQNVMTIQHPFDGVWIAVLAAVILSGCVGTRHAGRVDVPRAVEVAPRGSVQQVLRDEIENWHGTPHVWGGASPRGADCSGFVHSIFRDLFAIELPRTTSEQVRAGQPVSTNDLRPGDLIFFRPTASANHVGIYLDGGYFAHISTSRGLMYSHVDERYWKRAYWTSRRILHSDDVTITTSNPVSRDGRESDRRGGW